MDGACDDKGGHKILHITFRLYMTFWPAHKATRSVAVGQNVAEKNRTKAVDRLRFFVARGALTPKHIQTCYVPLVRTPLL
jgi:hypothetical protein